MAFKLEVSIFTFVAIPITPDLYNLSIDLKVDLALLSLTSPSCSVPPVVLNVLAVVPVQSLTCKVAPFGWHLWVMTDWYPEYMFRITTTVSKLFDLFMFIHCGSYNRWHYICDHNSGKSWGILITTASSACVARLDDAGWWDDAVDQWPTRLRLVFVPVADILNISCDYQYCFLCTRWTLCFTPLLMQTVMFYM